MRSLSLLLCAFLYSGVILVMAPNAVAQSGQAGSVTFVAEVTPTDGHAEPVRQLTFYLLRKSMGEIQAEAEQSEPPPDRDRFIDGLEVSPELKAWMKKHGTVDLTGADFTKHLTADEVIGTPEFYEAYKNVNGASFNAVVSDAKIKESDRKKNPEKYKAAMEAYKLAVHHYIETNPDTLDGMDAELRDKNPNVGWLKVEADQRHHVEHRVLQLAQTEYFVAKIDTDLDGRGTFSGLAPGNYWITTLNTPALAGDVRLRWDDAVSVRAGQTAYVELSNVNARETAEQSAH